MPQEEKVIHFAEADAVGVINEQGEHSRRVPVPHHPYKLPRGSAVSNATKSDAGAGAASSK